jgi:hypothetical protein
MKAEVKARQYWAVRHNGDNGDLILGRVKSVRSTGEVVLVNLLTDKISTKNINVLRVRNKRVRKDQADQILDVCRNKGKFAARKEAVKMKSPYEKDRRQQELPLEPIAVAAEKCGIIKANVRADIRAFVVQLKRLQRDVRDLQEKLEKLDVGLSG